MDKRKGFLVSYLIIPVCFLVAVIAVGLIRKHSLIEIYNDGLGITALYYLFVSLFIYIRWEHFSNKKQGVKVMDIVYTVLGAIVCMILVISIDAGITKLFDEKSIMQKNYIKMSLSYFIGIFVFLLIVRLIFS